MNNKKFNTILLLSILVLLYSTGCKNEKKEKSVMVKTKQWISVMESSPSPAKAIKAELFKGNTVLVSETPGYIENIAFLQYLIPSLYDSGITTIGVWFLEASEQNNIDSFIKGTGTFKDGANILAQGESEVNYDEYINFLLNVSLFNKNLEKGEPIFRLIGLSEKGSISLNGLKILNRTEKDEVSTEEDKSTLEANPESPDVEPENDKKNESVFIWWKREGIVTFKLNNQKSTLFYLHAPPNPTLSSIESANKESLLFEKALVKVSPHDYVKAISLDSVTDLISNDVAWDWYILNGPASQFNPLKESNTSNKDISSQWKSNLKKFQKEL